MELNHLKILLADDDKDDCIFFKAAVNDLIPSANLTTVNDGEQLMQLLTTKASTLPHVLFLDLNMPRKNGFECLSEIKLDKKLREIIVVVYSTSFEQEVVNQLYQDGAHFFIRKPAEFLQFKKIIQQTLKLIARGKIPQPTRENFVLTVQTI